MATALSRITGFGRVIALAAAMGTSFLANTYQTANTAPNILFELVAAGVLTSIFVPTFVDYLVKREHAEAWRAGNALASLAIVFLTALAVVLALVAPLVMRVLTLGVVDPDLRAREISVGTALLRLFAPQVVFYGLGVIMTAALHAHRRFALAAVAPIGNNLVVIAVYLGYAAMRGPVGPSVSAITTAEILLLGLGTTLGVVVMTLSLWPQLRALGWRFRFTWDPRHPTVTRAKRIAGWALGYAGGYQAGLIVVLLLANRVEGGVAAYQWAFTFFYVPYALFAVPIFHVLFPEMSEDVARGATGDVADRLRRSLALMAFLLVPISAFFVVAGAPLAILTLRYGVMTEAGAVLVGRVLSAFALGLPAYSAFLLLTRAFYALSDTKAPALTNAATVALSSVLGAFFFVVADEVWSVAGLALGHSIAFTVGALVLAARLERRVGRIRAPELTSSIAHALAASIAAAAAMAIVGLVLEQGSNLQALLHVAAVAAVGAGVYLALMRALHADELSRIAALWRRA